MRLPIGRKRFSAVISPLKFTQSQGTNVKLHFQIQKTFPSATFKAWYVYPINGFEKLLQHYSIENVIAFPPAPVTNIYDQ